MFLKGRVAHFLAILALVIALANHAWLMWLEAWPAALGAWELVFAVAFC